MKIIESTKKSITVEINKKELSDILGYQVAKQHGFNDTAIVHTHLEVSMNVHNNKVKTTITVTEL